MAKNKFYNFFKKNFGWILFVIVVTIAVFLRFYKLGILPPGLHPGEAVFGIEAFKLNRSMSLKSLYSAGLNGGIFVYLQAITINILGNTVSVLRLMPAIFGVLGVIATFLWMKEWFGGRAALIGSFLMAISPWMITISRSSLPASLVPFFISITIYFATKAIRTNKNVFYLFSSLTLALGLYTYLAFWAILPAILIGIIVVSMKNKKWFKKASTGLVVALITFLIVAIPIIFAFSRHSQSYISKLSKVSFLSREINNGKPLQSFADGLTKNILAFNFRGDENYHYNLAGLPLLNTFVGIMFVLGIMIAAARIKRIKYMLLIIVFVFSILPAVLSPANAPSALKLIASASVVFVFAGIGANYLLAKWYSIFPVNSLARNLGLTLVLTLMFMSLWQSYKQYFVAWAQDPKTYRETAQDATEIARYLNNKSNQNPTIYVIADNYSLSTINYMTDKKAEFKVLDSDTLKGLPIMNGQKVFIVQNSDNANAEIDLIKAKFPNGHLNEKFSDFTDQKLFYVYVVNQ
ncbi:MAG: glycosyltransferase family 39 protein [bacterium]|nr:glycosyltransferase family 39 protein [bacterium]